MAKPLPLTQTPPAILDWSRTHTPAATAFGDIYFSIDGGLDETRAVFLKGCGLPDRWQNRSIFTIAELGFGSGLNFLATWQLWTKTTTPTQRLHFVSIEKFPFDRVQLARALSVWPELESLNAQLINAWPGRVKGIHRLNFGAVTLTLVHEDVEDALDQLDNLRADAWFLDGFSPSGNPAMWSEGVMTRISTSCASGSRLATFSVAGAVRTALKQAGFEVRKMPGFGRKRHRLEAEFSGKSDQPQPNIERALIVGAGIAGRSLATALTARNIPFDIIDNRVHPAASENPAALVKPRFDLQDRPESRFFLSAYLYSLRSYPQNAVLKRGVLQIPKTEKEAIRFEKLATQNPLGDGHLDWKETALRIESAAVINPSKIFDQFDIRTETLETAQQRNEYSHVFLAAGYGIRSIAPNLAMRFSRGQLSWANRVLDQPVAYGGYAINLDGGTLVGATHDRLGDSDPFELREEDDQKNLSALAAISGKSVTPLSRKSRASVRVTTPDTLPMIVDLGAGQSALTGLGSRGFTYAPLLAEALVADFCGEIGPLEKNLRVKFSTLR
ncbi:MAG: tRNA (5-methylaminomethyl-2-thiouridine)(34)-methyltransferase MnmD [Litorimonas sp.]